MRLNDLGPAKGSVVNRKRVGRGIGSGQGKTCGRGHKGQHSRSGGFHKVGFEGGQMPLQRRLPRSGFNSALKSTRGELRLDALAKLDDTTVTLPKLVEAGLVSASVKRVKIIASGEIGKAMTLADQRIAVTKGARRAIESAGGAVEG